MKSQRRITTTLFATLLVIAGCGKTANEEHGSAPATPSQPTTAGAPAAAAKDIFAQRCVPCHGVSGQGDGVASASLDPKPRKYADAEWQASVTDEYLEKIIKFGGAAVNKSPAMPNNPDLTPEVVAALKDIVRNFNKK